MNTFSIETILVQLKRERDRLDRAITALSGSQARTATKRTAARKRGPMPATARKRLSALMKRRWAERKKRGKASL